MVFCSCLQWRNADRIELRHENTMKISEFQFEGVKLFSVQTFVIDELTSDSDFREGTSKMVANFFGKCAQRSHRTNGHWLS